MTTELLLEIQSVLDTMSDDVNDDDVKYKNNATNLNNHNNHDSNNDHHSHHTNQAKLVNLVQRIHPLAIESYRLALKVRLIVFSVI